ncbi:MAG: epoxyqueuosine reductase [Clostridia bacterium]|nr:epoxyqueuosine reductase [Clostridia bacterium]
MFSCRAKSRIPENSQSVIVYLFPYYLGDDYYKNSNLSKYAVPEDYHRICGEYLEKAAILLREEFSGFSFQSFCDNSPINEVKAAALAGLGVRGENSLLINDEYGSFCFIGEIVTDMKTDVKNCELRYCLKCGLCKRECVNNAISEAGIIEEKCLSSITQKKGELKEDEKALILNSGCIWGCDACQNICPMNKNVKCSPVKEFYENVKPRYEGKADYSEDRAFSWRKNEVIERNLEILCCKKDKNQL